MQSVKHVLRIEPEYCIVLSSLFVIISYISVIFLVLSTLEQIVVDIHAFVLADVLVRYLRRLDCYEYIRPRYSNIWLRLAYVSTLCYV